jgi:hypothetical protein
LSKLAGCPSAACTPENQKDESRILVIPVDRFGSPPPNAKAESSMTSPGASASASLIGDLLEHFEDAGEGNLLRTRSSEPVTTTAAIQAQRIPDDDAGTPFSFEFRLS